MQHCPPYGPPGARGVTLTSSAPPMLSPSQSAALDALKFQYRITSWPYYSRVKFFATKVAVETGFTYTLNAGTEARAFSYQVGQTKTSAGYTTADGAATIADTNLTQANQTTGGQNVLIHGIAIQIVPAALHLNDGDNLPHRVRLTDARFLAALFESVSIQFALNGDENVFRMGSLGQVPGAGGLMGGAQDTIGQVALAGEPRTVTYPTNSWPVRTSYFKLPEGLIWRNQSNADSQVNVIFNTTRTINLLSGGDADNATGNTVAVNDDGVATGTEGYTYPSEVVVELLVHLMAKVEGPRTRSA